MSEAATPRVVTQYPHGGVQLLTSPSFVPVSAQELLAGADVATNAQLNAAVANLQAQITALAARVTALENALQTGGTA